VQALHRAGVRVGVVAPDFRGLTAITDGAWRWPSIMEDDNGVPTYRCYGLRWFPLIPGANAALWIKAGLSLVENYIRDHDRPDLVHAHCALYAGCLAEAVKRKHNIPYVLTEHSSYFGQHRFKRHLYRRDAQLAYKNADSVTVVSPALGEKLRFEIGMKGRDWIWTPNMVEREFEPFSSGTRADVETFRFLNVGVMTKVKGQRDLLRAFARVFQGKRGIELRIVGDGPEMEALRALALNLGINDQVRFLGLLGRDAVIKEMREANVFVLSSHYETFGVVLIEALACGIPVVATACGGPDCIIDKNNGYLVPPKNPQQLANGMLEIFSNVHAFSKERLRQECLRRFGEASVIERVISIYSRVLAANSRSGSAA